MADGTRDAAYEDAAVADAVVEGAYASASEFVGREKREVSFSNVTARRSAASEAKEEKKSVI